MKPILASIPAALAVAALAACSSPAPPPPAVPASSPAVQAAASARPLAPLTPGHFPPTTNGKLARAICANWSGLRQEYAGKLAAGTSAFDLNGWFSGPAWKTVQDDSTTLGNDPAYGNLETSLGLVITGDAASTANAAALDKACADAN